MSAATELHTNPQTPDHMEEPKVEKIEPLNELSEPTHQELEIRRRRRLAKSNQVIALIFMILEMAIAFRIVLELIAANSASPFAHFVYQMTGTFLAPFVGLTVTPSADGAVLDLPALIAMAAYGVLYWLIVRVMWVIFDPAKARDAAKYKPDL